MQKKIDIKNKKSAKITFMLSNKDMILLDRYSKLNNITKKSAAKKIIKEFLAANVTMPEDVSENQLNLFTPRETDIFDYVKEL